MDAIIKNGCRFSAEIFRFRQTFVLTKNRYLFFCVRHFFWTKKSNAAYSIIHFLLSGVWNSVACQRCLPNEVAYELHIKPNRCCLPYYYTRKNLNHNIFVDDELKIQQNFALFHLIFELRVGETINFVEISSSPQ